MGSSDGGPPPDGADTSAVTRISGAGDLAKQPMIKLWFLSPRDY